MRGWRDKFDSNNDNGIDLAEWYFARTSGPDDAGLPVVETLVGIDLNGDGNVKAGEFVKVLKDPVQVRGGVVQGPGRLSRVA